MTHRILVSTAGVLYAFAVIVGVFLPLVWHPFKLLTDADYSREHQRRGVAAWRGGSGPPADLERGIRLDEVQRLRGELFDAGAGEPTFEVLDERAQRLRAPERPTPPAPAPGGSRPADPVAANARHVLWAVAAAGVASLLLALDALRFSGPRS